MKLKLATCALLASMQAHATAVDEDELIEVPCVSAYNQRGEPSVFCNGIEMYEPAPCEQPDKLHVTREVLDKLGVTLKIDTSHAHPRYPDSAGMFDTIIKALGSGNSQ